MESATERRIIVLSDATGETAAQMIKAAMVQFKDQSFVFSRYKNVRTQEQIDAICGDAAQDKSLIVFTIVSPDLRTYLIRQCRKATIPSVDLIGPLLAGLAKYFHHEPAMTAGLLHDVNETYFQRIDAMEYTIAHDDGRDLSDLDQADIVILGISRTSKTPLSMYLSQSGWKVVNIPMILDQPIPEEIFSINQRKVVGLTIDTEALTTIRRNRLMRLGQDSGGEYADIDQVNREVEYANELFRKNRRWAVFNVTGKALEETASEIVKLMASRRLVPSQSDDIFRSISKGTNVKK